MDIWTLKQIPVPCYDLRGTCYDLRSTKYNGDHLPQYSPILTHVCVICPIAHHKCHDVTSNVPMEPPFAP